MNAGRYDVTSAAGDFEEETRREGLGCVSATPSNDVYLKVKAFTYNHHYFTLVMLTPNLLWDNTNS